MTSHFQAGDRVLTRRFDPPWHTRLPRYSRGAVGTVLEVEGSHPRPDERSRGLPAATEPVYSVRFQASDLFGQGDHAVVIALWESYLEAAT